MKLSTALRILAIVVAPLAALFSSCKDDQPWDELPTEIAQFITQYFPNSAIDNYTETGSTYHVRITNGPGITFDKNYSWETINGYGMPLPEVLLFDQLPPALYKYLEETTNLSDVFTLERNPRTYTVVLLETTLTYTIETQEITGSTAVKP